ncbi:Uncharacterized protein APZ42_027359 [Daphnia magna]|uniref:Uncharacterized protein n=1 Tax=Daphnia magna TaxID=35525 RepID=A0A164RHZ1_9CRUS|nr:Uncharacterized protein APZ42_027359 [Daphnia magna]
MAFFLQLEPAKWISIPFPAYSFPSCDGVLTFNVPLMRRGCKPLVPICPIFSPCRRDRSKYYTNSSSNCLMLEQSTSLLIE